MLCVRPKRATDSLVRVVARLNTKNKLNCLSFANHSMAGRELFERDVTLRESDLALTAAAGWVSA